MAKNAGSAASDVEERQSRRAERVSLPEHLPYQLLRVSSLISLGVSRLFNAYFDISTNEWRILAVLGYYGSQGAGELAERVVLDRASASRSLARLEKRGLINRDACGRDRRRRIISLTSEGQDLHDRIAPLSRMRGRMIGAALTQEERDAFIKTLHKLEDQVAWLNREEADELRLSRGLAPVSSMASDVMDESEGEHLEER